VLFRSFDKYLAKGRPAYFNRKRLSSRESIDVIHQAGGLAVLAHPKELRTSNYEETDEIVKRLVYEGLEGLEVYSSAHDKKDAREYLKMARRHRLFVTGGSDFHGDKKSSIELGILGDRRLDDSVVREMKERLRRP
jgi:predicted metal-dependent phosphoesterase TrpH